MIHPEPVTLERNGVRLEPMTPEHAPAMEAAAADGELWKLWFTSVPDPGGMAKYIEDALKGQQRRPHAAVGRAGSGERQRSSARRAITTSSR